MFKPNIYGEKKYKIDPDAVLLINRTITKQEELLCINKTLRALYENVGMSENRELLQRMIAETDLNISETIGEIKNILK